MNWQQLRTILWLRMRLTRNQWIRSGGLGAVLAAIIALGSLALGGMAFTGAFLGGWLGLGEASPLALMGIWLGATLAFLFIWALGLMIDLQRSESIDLQRLMHLPVMLGQLFTINYLASHLTLSIVICVPAMIGFALGLVLSRGPAMILLLPLALSMLFMVTAWTYCLRGWLATLMTNPRRRRSIIACMVVGFILISQAPNLYFNVIHRAERRARQTETTAGAESGGRKRTSEERVKLLLAAQKFIPPLWLPAGAHALAEHRPLPALLGMIGGFTLGALGLRRAYRTTLRFYTGEIGGNAPVPDKRATEPVEPITERRSSSRFLELQPRGVPEQAVALALATFRSYLRAPEVKIAWGTSFIVMVVLIVSVFSRAAPKIPGAAKPFVVTGMIMFGMFMLAQFLTNQFGFDRHGFRALVLSPARRDLILLGKNLATLPVAAALGLLLLAAASFWLRLPIPAVLGGLFQLIAVLGLASLCGNLLSIFSPFRINQGSMKPTKMPARAMIVMVLFQFLFPIVLLPALLPPLAELIWRIAGLPAAIPVNLILSLALAAFVAFIYWRTLESFGRLLQERELKILNTVTLEVE